MSTQITCKVSVCDELAKNCDYCEKHHMTFCGQLHHRLEQQPRHPLDKLDVHDLSALRRIIGEVIAEGDWNLSDERQHLAFLNTIEHRIVECAAPNVKGATQ